jgi:hypothetical protein
MFLKAKKIITPCPKVLQPSKAAQPDLVSLRVANYNDLSLTDSSGSHKSQDYFIRTSKPGRHLTQSRATQPFEGHTASSQSPSSTTTTLTDYAHPLANHFNPHW